MQLEGKIKTVNPTQVISEKFQKREFVIETTTDLYPQTILLQVTNDKCAILDNLKEGDNVKCSINIRGREWTNPEGVVKVFNTIEAWRIEQIGSNFDGEKANIATKSAPSVDHSEVDDDLPF